MYNWGVDTKKLQKNREDFIIWKLEQQINFGLKGERLDLKLLKKYWNKLKLDPKRKKVLFSWLWQGQSSPKNKKIY